MRPEELNEEMPEKYDLESMGPPEKGRYYEHAIQHAKLRELSPELAEKFPDSESVNEALAEYLKLKKQSA